MSSVTNTTCMFDQTHVRELVIPASLSVISPNFLYQNGYLTTVTFLHSASDPITMPETTGEASGDYMGDGGAFHLGELAGTKLTKLTIITDNETVKAYPYAEDLRDVTFKSLSSVLNTFSLDDQLIVDVPAASETETLAPSEELLLFNEAVTNAQKIITVDASNLDDSKAVLCALDAAFYGLSDKECTEDIISVFKKAHKSLSQLISDAEASLEETTGNMDTAIDDQSYQQSIPEVIEDVFSAPEDIIPSE